MEIRYLTPDDDLAEISGIYEQSWKFAYKGIIPQEYLDSIPQGRWAGRLISDGRDNLLLIDGGKPVGTACICASRWESCPDSGEIVSIYLLPEYIGRGFGSALLKACIAGLDKKGFSSVILWVLEGNVRARRFYEKHGFVCTDGYMDDIIGGKELREVMYRLELRGETDEL